MFTMCQVHSLLQPCKEGMSPFNSQHRARGHSWDVGARTQPRGRLQIPAKHIRAASQQQLEEHLIKLHSHQ